MKFGQKQMSSQTSMSSWNFLSVNKFIANSSHRQVHCNHFGFRVRVGVRVRGGCGFRVRERFGVDLGLGLGWVMKKVFMTWFITIRINMGERDLTIIVEEPLGKLEVAEILATTTSLVKDGIEPNGRRRCIEWCAKHRLIANSMDCQKCDCVHLFICFCRKVGKVSCALVRIFLERKSTKRQRIRPNDYQY